jgi:predicted transcriptional regulator
MALKQHGFKLDLDKPEEIEINEFLQGKPTTYIVVEAMKLYVRTEKAKQAAIDTMIGNMQAGLFSPAGGQQAASNNVPAPQHQPRATDAIKEFDM